MDELARQNERVDAYLRQNNKSAAVNLLFFLISLYAGKKDFNTAEALKRKLCETNPMALFEIIKSDEIIKKEKSGYLYQEHLLIWAGLYDRLMSDEICALYSEMKKAEYDTNDVIFAQGNLNNRLYFIDQGYVKMTYQQKNREVLLQTAGPGGIFGTETFFSVTVCTASLTALSQVKLSFLEKDILALWQNELPELVSKLNDYCLDAALQDRKGINRRLYKRVRISGKIIFQLMNIWGQPDGKVLRGTLSDVSAGGLSFLIRTLNKKNPPLLLGRRLAVKFILPTNSGCFEIRESGTIIGVIDRLSDNYSVHIKFDEVLDENIVQKIDQMAVCERITRRNTDIPSFIQRIKKMLQ
jgi:CRP-like cAMP-binding protein